MIYKGSRKKERFSEYLEQELPALPKRSVMVWDNESCHTDLKIKPLLAETGNRIMFLPPYSLDRNRIERIEIRVKA